MVHAFMLMVVIGVGEFREIQPNPMYFQRLHDCLYYAERTVKQYKNYPWDAHVDPRDRVTAYCKPVYVEKGTVMYDK